MRFQPRLDLTEALGRHDKGSLLHSGTDCVLELCKNPEHLEQRPSGGRGCVSRLLFEIEVAPSGIEFPKKADEILQRSAKPVDRPRGNDIDLATHDLFQKPIELRPFIAPFGAADAFVGEFVCDDPSLPTTDCLGQSSALVVNVSALKSTSKLAFLQCEIAARYWR